MYRERLFYFLKEDGVKSPGCCVVGEEETMSERSRVVGVEQVSESAERMMATHLFFGDGELLPVAGLPIGVEAETGAGEAVVGDIPGLLAIVHGMVEPNPLPGLVVDGEHHLVHKLKSPHDGAQVVGVLYGCVAFP